MTEHVRAKAAQLEQEADVQQALQQTATTKTAGRAAAATPDKAWLVTCLVVLGALAALHYVVQGRILPVPARFVDVVDRFVLGAMIVAGVLGLARAIEVWIIGLVEDRVDRYDIKRVFRLVVGLGVAFVAVSVVFVSWYTAVVSLGLISLILGFALQRPIMSFIGWAYILVKRPYRVGQRIVISGTKGDVIDVAYLDTTLWEIGGEHLSTDHPSGRIVKFPNSLVLQSPVYNYSWPLFPYIWSEIKLHVAYDSDLEFVGRTMQEAAEAEVGEAMMERVAVYRELLKRTPVDDVQVQERPVVMFRVSENTWLEAIVRYLVEPKHAGQVKTRLVKELLSRLNAEPERARFPKGDAR